MTRYYTHLGTSVHNISNCLLFSSPTAVHRFPTSWLTCVCCFGLMWLINTLGSSPSPWLMSVCLFNLDSSWMAWHIFLCVFQCAFWYLSDQWWKNLILFELKISLNHATTVTQIVGLFMIIWSKCLSINKQLLWVSQLMTHFGSTVTSMVIWSTTRKTMLTVYCISFVLTCLTSCDMWLTCCTLSIHIATVHLSSLLWGFQFSNFTF